MLIYFSDCLAGKVLAVKVGVVAYFLEPVVAFHFIAIIHLLVETVNRFADVEANVRYGVVAKGKYRILQNLVQLLLAQLTGKSVNKVNSLNADHESFVLRELTYFWFYHLEQPVLGERIL